MKERFYSPRQLALEVLNRVTGQGAYADVALSNALGRSTIPDIDRSLATELVYGCIRRLNTIDYYLSLFLRRPLSSLPLSIQNTLRLGAYQLLFTDIPSHAAVNESVEMAKTYGHLGTAGIVNAVLRKMALSGPPPIEETDPIRKLALQSSVPEWTVRLWAGYLGFQEARKLCFSSSERPPMTVRVNTLKISRHELRRDMEKDGVEVRECQMAPEGLIISGAGNPAGMSWFERGLFYVQDEGAMLVSRALDPRAGETVVDLCAGPGGKTTHIAALMANRGRILAVELHAERARMVQEACHRMGVEIVQVVQGDSRQQVLRFEGMADKVLLDVPCSGMGVIRRRVDLKWRMSLQRIRLLVDLQRELLAAGARCLRRGGAMVYSTCTLNPQENEDQVEWFLRNHPDFIADDVRHRLDGLPGDAIAGTFLRLMPHLHGTDGFFAARMIKNG